MPLSDITENETESSAIFLNAAKGKSKREKTLKAELSLRLVQQNTSAEQPTNLLCLVFSLPKTVSVWVTFELTAFRRNDSTPMRQK